MAFTSSLRDPDAGGPFQSLVRRQQTLNRQGNPGLKEQGAAGMVEDAIPGALTTAGIPDQFEAQDNKEFFRNNARLTAMTDPGGGSWRASTGVRPSPMDRGGVAAPQPSDSLRGMSSFNNPKPMDRNAMEMDNAKLRSMELSNDRESTAQGRDNRTMEQKLAEWSQVQGVEDAARSASTISNATTQFDPTVAALESRRGEAALGMVKAKSDADVKGYYELERERERSRGGVEKTAMSSASATLQSLLSNQEKAVTNPNFTPEQKKNTEDYIAQLKGYLQQMGAGSPSGPFGALTRQ